MKIGTRTSRKVASAQGQNSSERGPTPPAAILRVLNSVRGLGLVFVLPALVIIFGVIVYPLLHAVRSSFYDVDLRSQSDATFVGLDNYRSVLTSEDFPLALTNSVVLTVTTVVLELVIGLGLALAMHKHFRGRGLVRSLLVLPWPLPSFIAAFAWIWLLDYNFGLINHLTDALFNQRVAWLGGESTAMVAVIAVNVWKTLPWSFVTLTAGLSLVPTELLEASRMDGAGKLQELRHVILPSMRSVIIVVVLLRTIWTFNEFEMVYLLTGGGPGRATYVLPIALFETAFVGFDLGRASAIGVIILCILAVFGSVYLRQETRGRDQHA